MRNFLLGLLAGAAMTLTAASISSLLAPASEARAQNLGGVKGAGDLGEVKQKFIWKSKQGTTRRMTFKRQAVHVPQNYGSLVDIDGENLWFIDNKGVIRNVIIGTRLYQIER